ncbi:MAG: hypothetical protein ABFS56_27980, partial [Pseudomonadota bacterium]
VLETWQVFFWGGYHTGIDRLGALKVNKSACLQAGIDPDKVEATIETFNLNCDRLCLARKTVLEKLADDFEQELANLG